MLVLKPPIELAIQARSASEWFGRKSHNVQLFVCESLRSCEEKPLSVIRFRSLTLSSVKFLSTAFQILLLASFAMWFGGFGFYVSFVVPVGNEVLGSSFEQGLITRQVTVPLNWLGVLAATLMALNLLFNRKQFTRAVSTIQVIAIVVMLSMQVALFWLHPQIDTFVDLETHEVVGDYDQFYWFHRLYLWASTIQWFAGWLWLACFALPNRVTTEVEQVVQV